MHVINRWILHYRPQPHLNHFCISCWNNYSLTFFFFFLLHLESPARAALSDVSVYVSHEWLRLVQVRMAWRQGKAGGKERIKNAINMQR